MKSFALTALTLGLGLCTWHSTQAAAYSDLYAFGDSLTDVGNRSIATNSHDPNDIAINQLAVKLGLEPLTPSLQGGTDWAVGGARSEHVLVSVVGLNRFNELYPNQPYLGVSNGGASLEAPPHPNGLHYLASSDGRADPQALYYLNGGGNDVYAAVSTAAVSFAMGSSVEQILAGTSDAMNTASNMLTDAARALSEAGARVILLSNVPLVGSTPAATAEGPLAVQLANFATEAYNTNLLQQAKDLNHVLLLDMRGINQITLNAPGQFGFATDIDQSQNCYVGACNQSVYGQGQSQDNPDLLLSADGVHPTVNAQSMLADYYLSVLTAANQVSLLPEVGLWSSRDHSERLADSLAAERFRPASNRLFITGYFGDTDYEQDLAHSANGDSLGAIIGGSLALTDALELGLAISRSERDADNAVIDLDSQATHYSGFARFHHQRLFAEASVSYSTIDYEDISRTVSFGEQFTLKLKNDTEGDVYNGYLLVGANLLNGKDQVNHNYQAGPLLSISYSEIDVDGYREASPAEFTYTDAAGTQRDPLGLHYGDQTRHLTTIRLGLFAQRQWQSVSAYGQLWYEDNSGTDQDRLEVGINSMDGNSVALPSYGSEEEGLFKNGVGALLGLRWSLTEHFDMSANFALRPRSEVGSLTANYRF